MSRIDSEAPSQSPVGAARCVLVFSLDKANGHDVSDLIARVSGIAIASGAVGYTAAANEYPPLDPPRVLVEFILLNPESLGELLGLKAFKEFVEDAKELGTCSQVIFHL